jgi:hypothetical protein
MPQFKDLGKKTSDLFKKSYDFKNEIKVTSNASGVRLESGGEKAKSFSGYTKANWKDDFLGDVEVEAHSTGVAKAKTKFSKVTDGVDVTVSGTACGQVGLEATYVKDFLSAVASANHNVSKGSTAVSASGVIGFDGVFVGGAVDVDGSGSVKNYNCGAEYATKDLTASLVTSNKGEDITVSFFQKLSATTSLGAAMLVKAESSSRLYTFGAERSLDKSTTLKAKADSAGKVGLAISHVLADPKLKLGLSSEFDATSSDAFKAQKFGVSLNFGDF